MTELRCYQLGESFMKNYEMIYNSNFLVCVLGEGGSMGRPLPPRRGVWIKGLRQTRYQVFWRPAFKIIEFLFVFHRNNSLATDPQSHRFNSVERPTAHPPSCFKHLSGMMTSRLCLMQLLIHVRRGSTCASVSAFTRFRCHRVVYFVYILRFLWYIDLESQPLLCSRLFWRLWIRKNHWSSDNYHGNRHHSNSRRKRGFNRWASGIRWNLVYLWNRNYVLSKWRIKNIQIALPKIRFQMFLSIIIKVAALWLCKWGARVGVQLVGSCCVYNGKYRNPKWGHWMPRIE